MQLYRPEDFEFIDDYNARCPAGKMLTGTGTRYTHTRGAQVLQYKAKDEDCRNCERRHRCLKNPHAGRRRKPATTGLQAPQESPT